MQRRSFVKSSVLAAAAGASIPEISKAGGRKRENRQFYELRYYSLKDATQQQLVTDYFENAFIPALNRAGSKPVGLFTELKPQGQTGLYALIPYNSLDDFLKVQQRLAEDTDYQLKGSDYLNAPATSPAYERIESWLLEAFERFPHLQAPAPKPRIFELRRYEHPSESAGEKKLEMFNKAGEVDIFKRLGFNPVFFSKTLIGSLRPNLTYMITFDDMAAHDSHWKAFGSDPEWKKISTMPDYADAKLISRITSIMLAPVDCSQI